MSETNESSTTTTAGFQTSPRDQWTLLSQGAEAKVWTLSATGTGGNSNGSAHTIVCKERFSKAYRHPDLDERLTKSRCRSEARVLEKCANKSDIRVPEVIRVEPPLLYIEYVEGPSLKAYLLEKTNQPRISFPLLAKMMGETIGKVHNLGVIHGDLTTSNMLALGDKEEDVEKSFQLVMIDFGLSKSSSSVEEQAVDLYVLERALESTHPDLPENFLNMVIEAYSAITNCESKNTEKKHQQTTLARLEQVRLRGRKRECFG
jgi:TP53 regulating kinase-like protein